MSQKRNDDPSEIRTDNPFYEHNNLVDEADNWQTPTSPVAASLSSFF